MKTKELKLVDERTVLGKDFKMYGSVTSPLFLAKSVADWIEHSNVSVMLKTVDDDEKVKIFCELNNVYTANMARDSQERMFLTENGVYEVLMQSRKPIAKEFKKEIKQILKQIRLTGGYVAEDREAEFIENYFPSFTESTKLEMLQDLLKQNKELKPKADAYDDFLNANGFVSLNKAAKGILKGRNKMMGFLRGKDVLFRDGYDNLPYETYINRGYFRVVYRTGRNGKLHGTTHVSAKGIEFIRKLYKQCEIPEKAVA